MNNDGSNSSQGTGAVTWTHLPNHALVFDFRPLTVHFHPVATGLYISGQVYTVTWFKKKGFTTSCLAPCCIEISPETATLFVSGEIWHHSDLCCLVKGCFHRATRANQTSPFPIFSKSQLFPFNCFFQSVVHFYYLPLYFTFLLYLIWLRPFSRHSIFFLSPPLPFSQPLLRSRPFERAIPPRRLQMKWMKTTGTWLLYRETLHYTLVYSNRSLPVIGYEQGC